MIIGLIRERKSPPDERVALSPAQCARIMAANPGVRIVAEPSPSRCFRDAAYAEAGIEITENMAQADVLLGIKEVPVANLIPGKTYFFFSHTKKKQPYNQKLAQALVKSGIRMIDYEALTYADGQRILGFGFYAGLVGAHNGLLTYGRKFGRFSLKAAHEYGTFAALQQAYTALRLPPIKIVITGSGKVAAGALEIMSGLDVEYIEPTDFIGKEYDYPTYTHLKGQTLYVPRDGTRYHREQFHNAPDQYRSIFAPYLAHADILLNGVYWDAKIPRLFEPFEIQRPDFRTAVISDITCDVDGSVSINRGSTTIADPVYGVDRKTFAPAPPYQPTRDVVDVMAVDNLPNELPSDASEHFGNHLEKYILSELFREDYSDLLYRATMCMNGRLTPQFAYLSDYAY